MRKAAINRNHPKRKSRDGCGNCKLRRVKCDETKPECTNCRKNHIACDYAGATVQMQSSHERVIAQGPITTPRFSPNETALTLINAALFSSDANISNAGKAFQLRLQDLDLLNRFQNRVVSAYGPPFIVDIYQAESVRLAVHNPYLMHVIMTCTTMHDRYLCAQNHQKCTPFESYHWAIASQLFNREISKGFLNCDQDAIWMAAAMMNWASLYAVETQDPEEVWPLSPATASVIPWFPIQKGFRTIWAMLRASSQFSIVHINNFELSERCLDVPVAAQGTAGIPQVLVDMCGLDESSTARSNPYHTAARALAGLLSVTKPRPGSLKFLAFINTTEPEFEALLVQRDPRSLVLMALWYALVPKAAWWISFRASLECRAICIYLDRYHANNFDIREGVAFLNSTILDKSIQHDK